MNSTRFHYIDNKNNKTIINKNRKFSDALVTKTIARINEVFNTQGNGATITHKNGNTYCLYAQESGSYFITDCYNIWTKETFKQIVPTIDDLAKLLLSI